MTMNDAIQIDRDAIAEVFKQQNLEALEAAVARGEWTQAEAAQAHRTFMQSDLLQTLITRDATALEAMLKGQVH